MGIKCTEQTESSILTGRRNMTMPVSTMHKHYHNYQKTVPTLRRRMQLRKRALTSMGWRYHL